MPVPAILAAVGRAAVSGAGRVKAGGGRLLERAWALDSAWNLAGRVAGETLPQFQHACTVIVQGGPLADLRRTWFLCASVAFGRMLRSSAGNRLSAATMQATWDVTGKAAQIEIVYQANRTFALVPVAGRLLNQFDSYSVAGVLGVGAPGSWRDEFGARFRRGTSVTTDAVALIQQGPDQITVGSGWPGFLRRSGQFDPGRPGSSADPVAGVTFRAQVAAVTDQIRLIETRPLDRSNRSALREWPFGNTIGGRFIADFVPTRLIVLRGPNFPGASAGSPIGTVVSPTLPDDGRLVTTGEKTNAGIQPPRPILDGTTRTNMLTLVAAALTEPCFLPEAPPITDTPLYSRGLFVHDNGYTDARGEPNYHIVSAAVTDQRDAFKADVNEDPAFPDDEFPDGDGSVFGAGADTTTRDLRGTP